MDARRFLPSVFCGLRSRSRRNIMDDRKRAVQRQFGQRAGAYARSASHRRDADLELLIAHLQAAPSDRALDVATGTGFTAFALRPHVRSVVGADLTRGMLEEARRLTPSGEGFSWVVGDAEALPFAEQVESRQTMEAWLELAGADDARRRAIAAMLRGAPPQALEQIGYTETPEPSFVKRWVVLVGQK